MMDSSKAVENDGKMHHTDLESTADLHDSEWSRPGRFSAYCDIDACMRYSGDAGAPQALCPLGEEDALADDPNPRQNEGQGGVNA